MSYTGKHSPSPAPSPSPTTPRTATPPDRLSTYPSPLSPTLHLSSHHHAHSRLKPTHLHFTAPDGSTVEWSSRRARKARYQPRSHVVAHSRPGGGAAHDGDAGAGAGAGAGPSVSSQPDVGERPVARRRSSASTLHSLVLRIPGAPLRPNLRGDVSFWVAFWFTLGSVVWVVNGFFSWLPYVRPSLSPDWFATAAAALGFVGGTMFEIGSYLMVVEALDRGRETEMGTAVGALFAKLKGEAERVEAYVEHGDAKVDAKLEAHDRQVAAKGRSGFRWWGKPLWHDLGYLAAVTQLFAASVFWIPTLVGLPGVIPGMADGKQVAVTDVFFWTPQVIGGCGFIVSSTMLIIEVQHRWYLPRPLDIGWQVGFWNLIGAIGFALCGALGFSPAHGVQYQSTLATFWGSWAFLIGSVLQCGEVVFREAPEGDEEKGEGPKG